MISTSVVHNAFPVLHSREKKVLLDWLQPGPSIFQSKKISIIFRENKNNGNRVRIPPLHVGPSFQMKDPTSDGFGL